MCRPAGGSSIRKAVSTLHHRGPDQQGVFEYDNVSLGAVRLRIIDLEGGDQPFLSDDGDSALVFNGEIYNHAELRQELEGLGHRFRSRCDTETVLHALLEWDTDALPRFRGMFALAFWTDSTGRLLLARDHAGIKPLYTHRHGRNLYFGSELKALFAFPEIDRRIDPAGLHNFTSLNYVPSPHTLVEGIEKLPAGHFLEWRAGHITTRAWWRLRFDPQPGRSLDESAEQLDGLLRDSVREHLVSDVPLGIWASGGLDSSAILHYAAEHFSGRLKTFSIAYRGRSFDDGGYARQMAELYGTEHHELDLGSTSGLADAVESLAYYSDEPGADAGALPVWFLARMTRPHATVVLSGEGADELFGGYHTYLADRAARPLRILPAFARRLTARMASALPVSDEKVGFEYKLKRMLRGSLLPPAEAHMFWNGTFSESEKKLLHLRNGHPSVGSLLNNMPASSKQAGHLNRYLWLDQHYYLPDNILYKCDRMSMAHSVEVRPPFLDRRVMEFAACLPENQKISGWNLKAVLRHLMRDKLPPAILRRRKEGFDIPAHEWLRGVLRPLLLDTLTRDAVEGSGLFHWPHVESLIRNHLERRVNLGYHLWGLLTLFLWMRRWGIVSNPNLEQTPEMFDAVSVMS
ncbi:MAG: asparagine synthase (glutamine-hydrolyzing) [Acidobacteriota bacterium]|nr:asparagine synthase (glutamine-hydrolyzing) [Acidobacteriota bacterium]